MRKRYHQIYAQICAKHKAMLDFDNTSHRERSKDDIREGDSVYYFLSRVKPGLSKKLNIRWLGPFTVRKRISDSLYVIFPQGKWASNPREISTIVSRLRKVDKDIYYSEIPVDRRSRINLPAISNDFHDMAEFIEIPDDLNDDDCEEVIDDDTPQEIPFGDPIPLHVPPTPQFAPSADADMPIPGIERGEDIAETLRQGDESPSPEPKFEPPPSSARPTGEPDGSAEPSHSSSGSDEDLWRDAADEPLQLPRRSSRRGLYTGSYADKAYRGPRHSRGLGKPCQ